MNKMVDIYLFGQKYTVPDNLTIMQAMEYAGFQLVRGCGCRSGFCGACAVIYRIKNKHKYLTCLACQKTVEDNMYVALPPVFPFAHRTYDIETLSPDKDVMRQIYPEIYSCIECNVCTGSCPKGINVLQYIKYAQRGEFEKCADESFECVMCGVCSSHCPKNIPHPHVAMLARRLNGKYISPKSNHLENRINEIHNCAFTKAIESLLDKPIDEIKELYNTRDIEK